MNKTAETILDFDQTCSVEDRFAVRRFIENFPELLSRANKLELNSIFSDGITISGISEFPIQKAQALELFYRKFFGRKNNYFLLPKLKLTFHEYLFHLNGSYEEFEQGILSGSGTIELALIRNDETFQIVKMKFYPRMLKQESYD